MSLITTFTETMRGAVRSTHACSGAREPLILRGLRLELTHPVERHAGFFGPITRGTVDGPGLSADVVLGDARILCRAPSGIREMRYRMIVVDRTTGRTFRIDGTKQADGSIRRAWQQTTTLRVEVRKLDPHADLDWSAQPVTPSGMSDWNGTCRVLVRDLIPQLLSIRGAAVRFGTRFGSLLLR